MSKTFEKTKVSMTKTETNFETKTQISIKKILVSPSKQFGLWLNIVNHV